MQFLVYIVVLAVSFSTILLELHWLTSPAQPPKAVVASSATPPKPKAEGPNAELSPVYPKAEAKAETPRLIEGVTGAVAADAKAPQETAKPAETAKAEPVTPAPVAPAAPATTTAKTETKIETTGAAVPADIGSRPVVSSATFSSTAQAAPAANAAAKNKCEVSACAAAYASFQASDCTYQPFEGPRQVCVKPPAAKTAAAPQEPNVPNADVRKRGRDEELRGAREVRRLPPRALEVDSDMMDDPEPVIVIRRPRW